MDQNQINQFDILILKKLADHHKILMNLLNNLIDTFESDMDIYNFIDNYYQINNLIKAFPIGISINQIVAHNSYHPNNLIKLKPDNIIKIDFGFVESGNIIDSARTFVYKYSNEVKAIEDSKKITKKLEEFIRKELETKGEVNIQRISTLTNALILSMGYSSLGLIGGHSIEYNKVHGKKLILNRPISGLPIEASNFIDVDWTLSNNEMFALEIFLPELKAEGELIQSVNIPITHYQINMEKYLDPNILSKLSIREYNTIKNLYTLSKYFVYEYNLHKEIDKNLIEKLIKFELILQHYPLEFKSYNGQIVKYIQYEDCYLILNNKLINLLD